MNVLREYLKLIEAQSKKSVNDKKLICHVIKLVDSNDDKMLSDSSFNFAKYYDSFNQLSQKDLDKKYLKAF